MGPHRQTFRHTFPTAAALMAGERRGHREHPTPGPYCLGFEDGTECCPARSTDAFGEVAIPYHIADLQVFEIQRVVGSQQRARRLVVEVAPLPLHVLMRAF